MSLNKEPIWKQDHNSKSSNISFNDNEILLSKLQRNARILSRNLEHIKQKIVKICNQNKFSVSPWLPPAPDKVKGNEAAIDMPDGHFKIV